MTREKVSEWLPLAEKWVTSLIDPESVAEKARTPSEVSGLAVADFMVRLNRAISVLGGFDDLRSDPDPDECPEPSEGDVVHSGAAVGQSLYLVMRFQGVPEVYRYLVVDVSPGGVPLVFNVDGGKAREPGPAAGRRPSWAWARMDGTPREAWVRYWRSELIDRHAARSEAVEALEALGVTVNGLEGCGDGSHG
jgi:hypothetical protein